MLDRRAERYPQIAGELARALPEDWTGVWVQVEMDARNGSVIVYYARASQPVPTWLVPPLRLYERFRALNDDSRPGAAGRWTTATFVMQRGGGCQVVYGYGSICIEEEQERLEAWKRYYLPSSRRPPDRAPHHDGRPEGDATTRVEGGGAVLAPAPDT